jgi:hypothetical protein
MLLVQPACTCATGVFTAKCVDTGESCVSAGSGSQGSPPIQIHVSNHTNVFGLIIVLFLRASRTNQFCGRFKLHICCIMYFEQEKKGGGGWSVLSSELKVLKNYFVMPKMLY